MLCIIAAQPVTTQTHMTNNITIAHAILLHRTEPKGPHCKYSNSSNETVIHTKCCITCLFIPAPYELGNTRGQTPRNDLFAGPFRLRAAAADRTRTGTDPGVATDPGCTALLTADLDVIRMFTSLSAAYYTKNLFICGRFLHSRFFRIEISFRKRQRLPPAKTRARTDILADEITVRTKDVPHWNRWHQ